MKKVNQFNKEKLVNYIWSNLLGGVGESIKVYLVGNEFRHTRGGGWLDEGVCVITLSFGDETPKTKKELKEIIRYELSLEH